MTALISIWGVSKIYANLTLPIPVKFVRHALQSEGPAPWRPDQTLKGGSSTMGSSRSLDPAEGRRLLGSQNIAEPFDADLLKQSKQVREAFLQQSRVRIQLPEDAIYSSPDHYDDDVVSTMVGALPQMGTRALFLSREGRSDPSMLRDYLVKKTQELLETRLSQIKVVRPRKESGHGREHEMRWSARDDLKNRIYIFYFYNSKSNREFAISVISPLEQIRYMEKEFSQIFDSFEFLPQTAKLQKTEILAPPKAN